MTKSYLQYFFQDAVQLEHYDMALEDQRVLASQWLDKVPEGYLFYPLVFINDELRIVGSAEYYEILGAVREFVAEPAQTS